MKTLKVVYTRTDVETVSTTYRITAEVDLEDNDDPDTFLKLVNEGNEDALDMLNEGGELEFEQTAQTVHETEEVGKPEGPVERFSPASP